MFSQLVIPAKAGIHCAAGKEFSEHSGFPPSRE